MRRVWSAVVDAFIPWGLLAVFFLTIVRAGFVAAATEPPRFAAELDPFDIKESLRSVPSGQLLGWYVYVYVDDQRVVCANPMVWNSPKVIECEHLVEIDDEVPRAQGGTPGPFAAYVPESVEPDPQAQLVFDEIDAVLEGFKPRDAR